MSNAILKSTGWQQRVRLKLGIDEAYLSDAELALPEIIDIAEANIIEQVPDYASKTGTDKVYLEAATVCECAILACPSMPARLPTKEQGPHVTFELDVNWVDKEVKLRAERDSYISKVIDDGSGGLAAVPHFSVISWRG